MINEQKKLEERNGTPEQFEKAVWRAYDDLFITLKEAEDAIDRYKCEWNKAALS